MSKKKIKTVIPVGQKLPVHVVIMHIDGKVVQVEARAKHTMHARQQAIMLARNAYPDGRKYKIKAVAELDADGILRNNSVLAWKPEELLADGDVAVIKPNPGHAIPAKDNGRSSKSTTPAVAKPYVSYAVAKPLVNPFEDADVLVAVAQGKVTEYENNYRTTGDQ